MGIPSKDRLYETLCYARDVPYSMVNDSEQLRFTIKSLQNVIHAVVAALPRWTHKKRGSVYVEFGRAQVQASTRPIQEGDVVVVYLGVDGDIYVRRDEEFEDGRFERVT